MSEGIIVANLGDAKYSVQLVYDDSGWVARVAATNASIAAALAKQSDLTIAVDEAHTFKQAAQFELDNVIAVGQFSTKPYVDKVSTTNRAYRLAKLAFNRNRAGINTGRMQLCWLNSVKPRQDMVVDVFCADYTTDLAIGLHVGLLEINNENPSKQSYVIHPNQTHVADIGDSTYDHARHGSMVTAASIQSAANWAFNEALYIGWQKYQPLYRKGTVTAVTGSNADVLLDAAISSRTPNGQSFGLNRNPSSTRDMLQTASIPIWYMGSTGLAEVGDEVVVLYFQQNRDAAKIIGIKKPGGGPPPPAAPIGTVYVSTFSDVELRRVSNPTWYTVDSSRAWAVSLREQGFKTMLYTVTVYPLDGGSSFTVTVDASGVAPHATYAASELVRTAAGFGFHGLDSSTSTDRGFFDFTIDKVARTVVVSFTPVSITPLPPNPPGWVGRLPALGSTSFTIDSNATDQFVSSYRLQGTTLSDRSGTAVFEMAKAVLSEETRVETIVDGPVTFSSNYAPFSALSWSTIGINRGTLQAVVAGVNRGTLQEVLPGVNQTFTFDGAVYQVTDTAAVAAGAPILRSSTRDMSGIGLWKTKVVVVSTPPTLTSYAVALVQLGTLTGTPVSVFAAPTNGSDWSDLTSLPSLTAPGVILSSTDLALLQLQAPL